MHTLITGAAGFLGSHLVDHFLALGHQVTGVDNFLTGNKANLSLALTNPKFRLIEADVIQPPASYLPTDILSGSSPIDLVLHFASPASPPIYQKHPVETYQVNAWGCHHLLSWLKDAHPSAKFLFASTSEVYGDPAIHPQPETYWGNVNPNGIRACYDESKRLGETICGVFERDFGMDIRLVRIFNTYGPRMSLNDGRVVPNFIKQTLAHQPLTIYGDGQQTRSFCYVDDLVAGISALALTPGLKGQTINLGNDREMSTLEAARIIWQVVHPGTQPPLTFLPKPGDDPQLRRPDLTKAKTILNYQPTISAEDGWQRTVQFFQET